LNEDGESAIGKGSPVWARSCQERICTFRDDTLMKDTLRASMPCRLTRNRVSNFFLIVLLAWSTITAHGAVTVDATTSRDQAAASTTLTSPAFSTTSGNELLLAFIATDYLSGTNTTVKS